MELLESSLSRVGSLEKPAILIQIPKNNYQQEQEYREEQQKTNRQQPLISENDEMSVDVPSSWTNNQKYKRTNVAITKLGSDF